MYPISDYVDFGRRRQGGYCLLAMVPFFSRTCFAAQIAANQDMKDPVMPYAFDEFRKLASGLQTRIPDREDPVIRYVCSLVTELAYHHVPEFEIDQSKRANFVPCERYNEIIVQGIPTDVVQYLEAMGFETPFVIVDRGIVAVGISLDDRLFIGFRGTKFLYEWRINLTASLVELPTRLYHLSPIVDDLIWCPRGRFHRGFLEETERIVPRIEDKMQRINPKQIFFTGHSLGGAVAAICELFFRRFNTFSYVFGSPRYCDSSAFFCSLSNSPQQVQRPRDIVPFLPPRLMGYADYLYQCDTCGHPVIEPIRVSGWLGWIWRFSLFLGKKIEPHCMENYRHELGAAAGAEFSDEKLTCRKKLVAPQVAH